jgi:hypothetical protein
VKVVFKVIGIVWLISVMLLLTIIDGIDITQTQTKLFCSYGKVFVEFTDRHSTWGTMMLDDRGVPIPCNEEEKVDTLSNTI